MEEIIYSTYPKNFKMKNNMFSVIKNKFLYLALFSVVAFSACKKEDVPATPTAGLMAFNLIPDSTVVPVAFVLNNSSITNTPLSYSNFTGAYLPVYSGPRTLEVYKANSDTTLATANYTFEANKYYSAFALGANGTYKNMIVEDNLDSLSASSGNAFIRYVNAIPDSSAQKITVSAGGTNDVSTNTHFGDVSDFIGVAPGDVTMNISNDSTISANKTVTLVKDQVYTFLLTGMPHATDTAKAVQIRYIINGTITQ